MSDKDLDYRSSGVDIQAGERTVENIKELVRGTYSADVLSDLGSFGGLFRFHQPSLRDPILVASTDGVGTKLRVAIMAGKYDSIGQDLVNHCVNDILVQGALPLFFLDYIGMGRLDPEHVQKIISGMVKACQENSCALIGGEMAEMPGIYQGGDFDLVGTIVGAVDQQHLLPANRIHKGDILIGIPSSGLHTNGYSLARKVVFEHLGLGVDSHIAELGSTVSELLLAVHKSYLPLLKPHLQNPGLHGLAHITGGGIPGNLKRVIPNGLTAYVSYSEQEMPPLFHWLQDAGQLSRAAMLETFNLGVGMIAVLDPGFATEFMASLPSFVIGEVNESRSSESKVVIVG
ncbi:MAG: phosphoribosylformylglycinamidine cyclo-ligase [Candidatus Syntrophosphaera sp.]|nr:phosphoribosylformylglycinamidine cyclo-ligase [Candidatus Syntrophosphaera sp.]